MKKNNFRNSNRPSGNKNASPRSAGNSARPSQVRGSAPADRKENQIPREWRIVIGTHAVNEVLKIRPKKVKGMWLKQGFENSNDLREIHDLALRHSIKVELKPEGVIEKFGPSQQGAAIFVDGAPEFNMDKLDAHEKSTILLLDGIEDPHNLGAIVRTSWLVGAHGVLIPEDRAVGLTPTVHKVACGGIEHIPVQATTNFSNYAETLKKKGYWIFGLSPRGKQSIFELDLPDKVIWAIGAEDKGLRVTTERLCDELVYIPQASSSASYNASVATAMALTETLRQHAAQGNRKKSHSDK